MMNREYENVLNFSSDKISIFMLLIDVSGSMNDSKYDLIAGIDKFKQSFEKFPEKNSIAVSLSKFNSVIKLGNFRGIDEMDASNIQCFDETALYYSINKAAKHLLNYVYDVIDKTGVYPDVTFIVFSDGEPCQDRASRKSAKETIQKLNNAGYTTVFVAFGKAISMEFGKKMGFLSTIDVNDKSKLVEFLGVELSQSVKNQSKSLKALGASFFSQANNQSTSDNYSATTQQALEDDSWIDDI